MNCINRFTGKNVYQVYLDVTTVLPAMPLYLRKVARACGSRSILRISVVAFFAPFAAAELAISA